MTDDPLRYSRQTGLAGFGPGGQRKLSAATVLVIGAGGLGSPASLYLATAGVGRLLINDFDSIDVTNLPRQILYSEHDAGKSKAQVAAERLNAINADTQVIALSARLNTEMLAEHVNAADVVLDCTDTFASRWQINQVCAQQSTALVSGAAIRTEGQLSVFRHDQPGGPCYRCLYNEADENLNDCAGQGILGPVAGTIGCMMATEALKFLTGIESGLEGKLWVYDAKSGSSRLINIPVRDDCPVCNS